MNKKEKKMYEIYIKVKKGVNRIFVVIDDVIITELIKVKEKTNTDSFICLIDAELAIKKQDEICLWLYSDEFGSTDYTYNDLFVHQIETSEITPNINNNVQQNQIIVYPPDNIEAAIIDVPSPLIQTMSVPRIFFLYKEPLLENDITNLNKMNIKNRSKFACKFKHAKLSIIDMEKIGFLVFTAYWYRTLVKIKYNFPKPSNQGEPGE